MPQNTTLQLIFFLLEEHNQANPMIIKIPEKLIRLYWSIPANPFVLYYSWHKKIHSYFDSIRILLFLEEWPLTIVTREGGTSKKEAMTVITSLLASPFEGGARTRTLYSPLSIFSIDRFLDRGVTVTFK
jgi:hypothetical protein